MRPSSFDNERLRRRRPPSSPTHAASPAVLRRMREGACASSRGRGAQATAQADFSPEVTRSIRPPTVGKVPLTLPLRRYPGFFEALKRSGRLRPCRHEWSPAWPTVDPNCAGPNLGTDRRMHVGLTLCGRAGERRHLLPSRVTAREPSHARTAAVQPPPHVHPGSLHFRCDDGPRVASSPLHMSRPQTCSFRCTATGVHTGQGRKQSYVDTNKYIKERPCMQEVRSVRMTSLGGSRNTSWGACQDSHQEQQLSTSPLPSLPCT